MKPHYTDDRVTLYHGDCIEVMRTLPDASVEAVVTDPPYGLSFMGKDWDNGGKMLGQMATGDEQRGAFAYGGSHDRGYADNDTLGFQAFSYSWATEALRVLKPGGHLLAFGGTRTWHRLAVAIEDAGFEVRDSIAWMYGSGFPKSHDVSKGIDKKRHDRTETLKVTAWIRESRDAASISNRDIDGAFGFVGMAGHWTSSASQPAVPTLDQIPTILDVLGLSLDDVPADIRELIWTLNGNKGQPGAAWAEREVVGSDTKARSTSGKSALPTLNGTTVYETWDITAPATPAAQQWQGWGTALKPAFEPIVVARKPLIGTVAANVLTYGTGALNIDGCRIRTDDTRSPASRTALGLINDDSWQAKSVMAGSASGRWPANVILDESQAAALDAQSGILKDGVAGARTGAANGYEGGWGGQPEHRNGYGGQGGASRFFYTAKANSSERPNVDGVAHPTVKPLDLMRYLVRLVTPPGGTVLEPFAGSGTTAEACIIEGFKCIAIEMTDEYLPLILDRITKPIETVMF
jgi:DNA modification methylase